MELHYDDIRILNRRQDTITDESVLTYSDLSIFNKIIPDLSNAQTTVTPLDAEGSILRAIFSNAARPNSADGVNANNFFRIRIENEIDFCMGRCAGANSDPSQYYFTAWNVDFNNPRGVSAISLRYAIYRPNTANMFKTGRHNSTPVWPEYAINTYAERTTTSRVASSSSTGGTGGSTYTSNGHGLVVGDIIVVNHIPYWVIWRNTNTFTCSATNGGSPTNINGTSNITFNRSYRHAFCLVSTVTGTGNGEIFNRPGTETMTNTEAAGAISADHVTRGCTIILELTKDYVANQGLPKKWEIAIQFTANSRTCLLQTRKLS